MLKNPSPNYLLSRSICKDVLHGVNYDQEKIGNKTGNFLELFSTNFRLNEESLSFHIYLI